MKNIKQTVIFPLHAIIMPEIPKELLPDIKDLAEAERFKPLEDSTIEKREALLSKMPEKVKKITEVYGVESPTDNVFVVLEVGNFLFDIYSKGLIKPESPLGKKVFEKRLQDVAEVLFKEDIEMPEDVKKGVQKVLSDDVLWKQLDVHVYVTVDNQKRFFMINAKGVSFFNEIMNEVLREFD